MGEIFKFKADGSTGRLVAVAAPSMADARDFSRLDEEVWKPTMSFYVPLERESTRAS
jgi:hypothetical protein